MAAGSTDTFASSSQTLSCFNAGLLKQEKFWHAEVMATASTGGFWEDDPEEATKKKVNELKRKFHSGRQLLIKHLPRDVTEEVSTYIYKYVNTKTLFYTYVVKEILIDPFICMLTLWFHYITFMLPNV